MRRPPPIVAVILCATLDLIPAAPSGVSASSSYLSSVCYSVSSANHEGFATCDGNDVLVMAVPSCGGEGSTLR